MLIIYVTPLQKYFLNTKDTKVTKEIQRRFENESVRQFKPTTDKSDERDMERNEFYPFHLWLKQELPNPLCLKKVFPLKTVETLFLLGAKDIVP